MTKYLAGLTVGSHHASLATLPRVILFLQGGGLNRRQVGGHQSYRRSAYLGGTVLSLVQVELVTDITEHSGGNCSGTDSIEDKLC